MNSGVPEGQTVPASLVEPIMSLMLKYQYLVIFGDNKYIIGGKTSTDPIKPHFPPNELKVYWHL